MVAMEDTRGLSHQRHFQKPLWDGQTSLNGKEY